MIDEGENTSAKGNDRKVCFLANHQWINHPAYGELPENMKGDTIVVCWIPIEQEKEAEDELCVS